MPRLFFKSNIPQCACEKLWNAYIDHILRFDFGSPILFDWFFKIHILGNFGQNLSLLAIF